MADDVLRVEGLAEFRKALRNASRDLPKALTRAHKTIAAGVASAAKPLSTTRHGRPTPSSATIRGSGTQSGAFIRVSGPTALGDEFGGGSRARTRQFRPHRGRKGYAIYPTIRAQRPRMGETLLDEIVVELEKKAFPD